MSKTVLVVDDSAAIRQSISYVLQQGGYEVKEAVDGLDGFTILQTLSSCDLVITDVNMPNMDGISLIKKKEKTQNTSFPHNCFDY